MRFLLLKDYFKQRNLKVPDVFTMKDLLSLMREVSLQNFEEKGIYLFLEDEIKSIEEAYPRMRLLFEAKFQTHDLEQGLITEDQVVNPLSLGFSYKPEGLFIRSHPVANELVPEIKVAEKILINEVVNYHTAASKFEGKGCELTFDSIVKENSTPIKEKNDIKKEDLIRDQDLDLKSIKSDVDKLHYFINNIFHFSENDSENLFKTLDEDIIFRRFIEILSQSFLLSNLNYVKNGFVWSKKDLKVNINKFLFSLYGEKNEKDRFRQVLGGIFRHFFRLIRKPKNILIEVFLDLARRNLIKDPFEGKTFEGLMKSGYISIRRIAKYMKVLTHKELELYSIPVSHSEEENMVSYCKDKFLKREYTFLFELRAFNRKQNNFLRSNTLEKYLTHRMISFSNYRKEREKTIIDLGFKKPKLIKIRDLSVLGDEETNKSGIESLTDSYSFLLCKEGLYFNNTNPNFGYNFLEWKRSEKNRKVSYRAEYTIPDSYIDVYINYIRQNNKSLSSISDDELILKFNSIAHKAAELMQKTYIKS
jgi:hypothetical protein